MIPYGRQDISEADEKAVIEVLRSDYITQGPAIQRFEDAVKTQCAAEHAVAMSSATAALHVACMALDLGPGDILWTSPNTFVASSNAALYCGADVDFVDLDPRSYNISIEALAAKLETAEAEGKLPKIVVPVHFAGQSCDMAGIGALKERYGFRVIEDASHAIGGSYRNSPVGNCAHSDICVFSFHPVKIVTTAEGGVATTQARDLAARMAMLRTHGITRDESLMDNGSDGPWYYEQVALGYNYRMTDIQAALGVSQFTRLADFINRRHEIRERYDAELADLPLILPWQSPDQRSALHLYPVQVTDEAPLDRAGAFAALRENGIGVNVLYIPVYRQPWYQGMGFDPANFPNAETYYRRSLVLPMYATLTEAEQGRVIEVLHEVLG